MNCSSISLCLCLSQVAHVDLTNAVAHPRGSRAVGDFNIITPFHEVKSYAHLWSVFLFLKKILFLLLKCSVLLTFVVTISPRVLKF